MVLALLALLAGVGRAQNPPAPPANPMDVPLQLIAEAQQSYQGIADYACLFIKRERIRGQLQPENYIQMRVRTAPFSVYLYWQRPRALAGQEACYVAGRNNGMLRAHSTGFLGVAGFVSLDPNDPRCLENSRHAITEAGIGNLIDRFGKGWEGERRLNRTQVGLAEYKYDERRCVRVETIHPDNGGGQFHFYRSLVYFDKQTHLPIRVENYDWPRRGGDPNGDLVESYSYTGLRLNVRLPDSVFNH
jgi:hypothetical protein